MNISKLYVSLGISFILLILSLVIGFSNVHKSNTMLKHIEETQVKLNFYVRKLNNDVKNNQVTILQTTILKENHSQINEKHIFDSIDTSIAKLENFIQEHPETSQSFKNIFKIIKTRTVSYHLVEKSLLAALNSKDKEDIEDAFIGFNNLTIKFTSDTQKLIELVNKELNNNITTLQKNNNMSSNILLISFFLAIFLISFSVYRFRNLHNTLKIQVKRMQEAESELKQAQTQLLKYNDDLEEEISKKSKELYKKIYTHFLSGLPNRNKLLEDIKTVKFDKVALLNIDKFQSFNDVYGEEIGNIALEMSAQFLEQEMQGSTLFIYHISGDEFAITSKDSLITSTSFITKIEKFLESFKEEKFSYDEKTFQFIMSAGIAEGTSKKLLAHADMALKDAKKRNIQLALYDDKEELEQLHKNDIECHSKLKKAIDSNKIVSFFQPIVPIQEDTKLPFKYESLVRMDDDGEIVAPFKFLEVAKANRIYYKVTRAVINNTFEAIRHYNIHSSLNFSLTDINNERTMHYFFDKVEHFSHPEQLTVELLETEDFNNYEEVYDFCVKVRSYGIKIALDDFGSGYSNFSHILKLPVDYIKIDASLISNIDRDRNSQIMVETIVQLAHKLHVLTIAEFVSSQEILKIVKSLQVDYAQGYYLGKPEPIETHIKKS